MTFSVLVWIKIAKLLLTKKSIGLLQYPKVIHNIEIQYGCQIQNGCQKLQFYVYRIINSHLYCNILAFLDELYDDNDIQQEFNHVIANPSR